MVNTLKYQSSTSLMVLLFFFGCHIQQKIRSSPPIKIEVVLPIVNQNNIVIEDTQHMFFYYNDTVGIFQIPSVNYIKGKNNWDKQHEEAYTQFFYYNLKSGNGFWVDTLIKQKQAINVTDFLTQKGITTEVFDMRQDSLVQVVEKSNFVTEKYITKRLKDDSYPDSSELVYRKDISFIPFSFQGLEKEKNKKLISANFFYIKSLPKRIISYRLSTIKEEPNDISVLLKLFYSVDY